MKDRKTTPSISEDEYQELLKRSKSVSSAPPPISPLNPKLPSLRGPCVVPPEPVPADWKRWKSMATVELWQGLLLSLNIEPTGGGLIIQNQPDEMALVSHKKGGGFIPYEYMDDKGITTEFLSRWHLLRNKLETDYAAIGIPPCIELTNFIGLPRFADIAIDFNWEPLPTELAMLAVINNGVTPETLTSDGQQATATQAPIDLKSNLFVPRIGWQVALFDSWPAMRQLYGRNPTTVEAIRFLRSEDKSGYIVKKGGDCELWWNRRRGPSKDVAFRTVENVISVWRVRGVIPA